MASKTATKRKPQARAEDSAAFGPIAERFRRAGDLDRAVSLCREGLQKFPDHISARVTLGWALLDLGNFNEARIELELVLRRAPDNLSAIRGLAELHDRSEHTMDLPMDGPGQWPPNPDTIEKLDSAPASASARAVTNDDIVDEAVWVPAADVSEQRELDGALRHEQTDMAASAPVEDGGGMWSATTEVEPEVAPLLTPAVGMSSMREIDPGVGAVSLSAFEEPAISESVLAPADPIAALDVDLEALIAEADTLEAAADVASLGIVETAEPTLVLDAAVDLSAFEEATAELTAGFDVVADPEPVAAFTELDSLVAAAEPEAWIASVELSPPVELVASTEPEALTAFAASAAPEALTASAEPAALVAPIEVEPELVASPVEELTAVIDDTPSFQLTPWDEAMAVQVDETRADEVSVVPPSDELTLMFDFETVPEPVAVAPAEVEPVVEAVVETVEVVSIAPVAVAVVDEEIASPATLVGEPAEVVAFAPVAVEPEELVSVIPVAAETAEVVSFVPVAAAAQVRSPLPGLERFLGQVQRRRLLMAESVA